MTATRSVVTGDLKAGDIVRTHGMVCRIESVHQFDSQSSSRDRYPVTTACVSTVTNPEEVREAGLVPMSFLRCDVAGHPEHCWHIQGNDLATWCVEA